MPGTAGTSAPYPPSLVDRLTAWIERLPWPWWLTYLGLAIVSFLSYALLATLTGDYQPGQNLPFHIWTGGYFAYLLALMHVLDRSAARALATFRPVLSFEQGESGKVNSFDDLNYRLTTLPSRPAVIAGLLGVVLGTVAPLLLLQVPSPEVSRLAEVVAQFGFAPQPASVVMLLIVAIGSSGVSGVFVYHTIHQLYWIDRIYREFTDLNLFRLQSLFAFSRTTALTAAGAALYNYAWFGTAPALLAQPASITMGAFFLGIVVITFLWPLYGAHRKMEAEKHRLMGDAAVRFESAVQMLHGLVDSGDLEGIDQVNKALSGLEIEQAALRRIPTWPWEPGTLRNLLTALLVPITIWLIQFALNRLLN